MGETQLLSGSSQSYGGVRTLQYTGSKTKDKEDSNSHSLGWEESDVLSLT